MPSRRADPVYPALALVGLVFALDLLWSVIEGSTGSLAYGLVDEPAHLATCLVALLAVVALSGWRPSPYFVAAALIASVAIDVDHIPGYLDWQILTGSLPRPYSHSLLSVALLVGFGAAFRGDARQVSLGLAFGVSAHLLRDLATGPGVSLLWPFTDSIVTLPYAAYAGLLALAVLAIRGRVRPGSVERAQAVGGRRSRSERISVQRLLSRRATIASAGPGSVQRR